MGAVLADTGYWLALANSRDTWHSAAMTAARQLSEPLTVTWPVITETSYLLGCVGGADAQAYFMDLLFSNADIHFQGVRHLPQIVSLMTKYQDRPMDLADASLVAAAEELNDGRILTIDVIDFGIYRWKTTEVFKDLLLQFQQDTHNVKCAFSSGGSDPKPHWPFLVSFCGFVGLLRREGVYRPAGRA